ncbi:MAG: hypothetical protein LBF94_04390 [Puniceicoccales bacterium]|jgi:hypothetical protein|nr:hypothetical protein [Puniceicoccales bacterium]
MISSTLWQMGAALVSTVGSVSIALARTARDFVAGGIAGGILGYATTNADNREIQDMAEGRGSLGFLGRLLAERYIRNGGETSGKRALKGAVIGFVTGLQFSFAGRALGLNSIICTIGSVIGAIALVQRERPFLITESTNVRQQGLNESVERPATETAANSNLHFSSDSSPEISDSSEELDNGIEVEANFANFLHFPSLHDALLS